MNNLKQTEESKMVKQEKPQIISAGRGIRAKVWKNENDRGCWYNVTFSRTYKDDSGNFQDSDSFGRDDLLHVGFLADQAFRTILKTEKKKDE